MPPKKSAVCEDESFVTMTVLTIMLEQQKEFYKVLLSQQQEHFKCFIQVFMDGTNKRLDGVIRNVQDLKTSLEFTQEKMERKSSHTEMDAKLNSVEKGLAGYKQDVDDMFSKLGHMENQQKRKNIIIA